MGVVVTPASPQRRPPRAGGRQQPFTARGDEPLLFSRRDVVQVDALVAECQVVVQPGKVAFDVCRRADAAEHRAAIGGRACAIELFRRREVRQLAGRQDAVAPLIVRRLLGFVHRRLAFADPGTDDYRNELLWTPETPRLIDATLTLHAPDGSTLDAVSSYTALRDIGVDGDRLLLNGRPYPLRLVLDQGYWPETGLTPPDDEAIRKDVLLAKAMGFNGVRKHQKIEDPRYLYWADHLGLLVWEEMPSAYPFTPRTIERVTREWIEVIRRDASHPCIITWVPFNESWGVPNLPSNPAEQHFVQSLYHLTRTLDPTRLVVGNDGWESVSTDVIGVHDYDADTERLARRYHSDEGRPRLFRHERPAGRLLVFDRPSHAELPIVLSEFGGLSLTDASAGTWGYTCCDTPAALAARDESLMTLVRTLSMLAGFCYTQFADTYQEANGLLYADRTPKFELERIARATCGSELPASAFGPAAAAGHVMARVLESENGSFDAAPRNA